MGVDWITCAICSENFPDCGPNGHCANCESWLCGSCHDEQVEKYGNPEEGSDEAANYGDSAAAKCDLCSGLIVQDDDVIEYLLAKAGMTKDQVVAEIKNQRGIAA